MTERYREEGPRTKGSVGSLSLATEDRCKAHIHVAQTQNRIPNQLPRPMVSDQPSPLRNMIVCPELPEPLARLSLRLCLRLSFS